MVLFVHGGPWSQTFQLFSNPSILKTEYASILIAQNFRFITNRGYAVLSCDYRGSTGYGKQFLTESFGEMGGKMQGDLVDAVDWAVQKGIANPKRVAIYGSSYGGYAALMGLVTTPDKFACAIDFSGPSNWISYVDYTVDYRRMQILFGGGTSAKEKKFLKSRSPVFRAEKITKPLLIAHGGYDAIVPQSQSDEMVDALRKQGKASLVTYLLFPHDGHGFRIRSSLALAAYVENFLKECLSTDDVGRLQPIGNDIKNANVIVVENGTLVELAGEMWFSFPRTG